ncbi:UNVERIFIED_CONTAM: Retrovirus-related Pol polyprotein from transposon TNT 1-94 [Sesamum radiatum]|uniref:Retrovirus-related Pol polyprotein from transposon TNT 1-94 n=1 Tax=Sesamum radiatum TaxID=300843 RepID=A0AAW2VMR4_SESRA
MIPDELEEDPEEDSMEYQDDDSEITKGNVIDGEIDVKTTFLYGELEEKIYMDQPEGFIVSENERKVCKLIKSIYGLKPAFKQLYEKFDKTILAFDFIDMGEADVILDMKLIHSTDGIVISQSHYVKKIIVKFGYQNSRIAKTLHDSFVTLFKNESGVPVAQLRYTSCLDRTHWDALGRVLRYLKGTASLDIHYTRFSIVPEGYSDVSL